MRSVPLRALTTVTGGGTPRKSVPEYFGGTIPWVTPKDMKRSVVGESEMTLTALGVRDSPAKPIPAGSVLVVVRSGVLKHTLPVALTSATVTVNQDMKALTPVDALDSKYLARLIKAREREVLGWVRATTADNFPIDKLLDMLVELPPIAEQRRIAAILDQADALRAKRRQVLAHLDDLTQSIFRQMFGSMTRRTRWHSKPLCELADTRLGKMLDKSRQTGTHARPYLRNANVQWFRLDTKNLLSMDFDERDRVTFALEVGDVLVCEGGEPGRAAIWNGELEDCYFQKALHRIRLGDSLLPDYFVRALKSIVDEGGLKDFVTSATIAHLTGEKLRLLPIPIPPVELQREFVARANEVRSRHALAAASAELQDEIFESLQSRAFSNVL